jgi:hypothetical protein
MPAINNFRQNSVETQSPAVSHFAITPSADELAVVPRAVYVGGGGNLNVTMDGVTVLYAVQSGAVLPIRPSHILAASTTATGIVGWT